MVVLSGHQKPDNKRRIRTISVENPAGQYTSDTSRCSINYASCRMDPAWDMKITTIMASSHFPDFGESGFVFYTVGCVDLASDHCFGNGDES